MIYEELKGHKELFSRRKDFLNPSKIKLENRNPVVVLEFFEGELKGTELTLEKNLKYQLRAEENFNQVPEVKSSFTIGKSIKADYNYPHSTLKQVQCEIRFDPIWGWQIRDLEGDHSLRQTCIYLANKRQIDRGEPSYFCTLFNKMQFSVGGYEFGLSVRNLNPTYLPEDLYDDDADRFMEETEEDVRKQMSGAF